MSSVIAASVVPCPSGPRIAAPVARVDDDSAHPKAELPGHGETPARIRGRWGWAVLGHGAAAGPGGLGCAVRAGRRDRRRVGRRSSSSRRRRCVGRGCWNDDGHGHGRQRRRRGVGRRARVGRGRRLRGRRRRRGRLAARHDQPVRIDQLAGVARDIRPDLEDHARRLRCRPANADLANGTGFVGQGRIAQGTRRLRRREVEEEPRRTIQPVRANGHGAVRVDLDLDAVGDRAAPDVPHRGDGRWRAWSPRPRFATGPGGRPAGAAAPPSARARRACSGRPQTGARTRSRRPRRAGSRGIPGRAAHRDRWRRDGRRPRRTARRTPRRVAPPTRARCRSRNWPGSAARPACTRRPPADTRRGAGPGRAPGAPAWCESCLPCRGRRRRVHEPSAVDRRAGGRPGVRR